MSEIAIPDYTEPIIAIRAWSLTKLEVKEPLYLRRRGRPARTIQLASVSKTSTVWPVGEPLEATCSNTYYSHHREGAPDAVCSCGIYAKSDAQGLQAEWSAARYIHGVVRLWGRVIPGETGWRAQYADIFALLARKWFDDETRVAAKAYDVPVLRSLPELTAPESIPTVEEETTTTTTLTGHVGDIGVGGDHAHTASAIDLHSFAGHNHVMMLPGDQCRLCGAIRR